MNFNHTHLLAANEFASTKQLEKITCVQVKYNGLRLLVTKQPAEHLIRREITAVTREGKTDLWYDLCQNASIKERIEALPMYTALDCEVHIPGVPETSIKTLLKQADPRITLTPFAMPWFGGSDMRPITIFSVNRRIQSLGFVPADTRYYKPVEVEGLLEEARESGIEGWMLKAEHYSGWWKLKPVKTFDAVVTDVERGAPGKKYANTMGAISVGLYGPDGLTTVCFVGGGFSDPERHMIWNNIEGTLGKVVEVAYDSLAANGAPKFPRFRRFRDDKEPGQCLMNQIRP